MGADAALVRRGTRVPLIDHNVFPRTRSRSPPHPPRLSMVRGGGGFVPYTEFGPNSIGFSKYCKCKAVVLRVLKVLLALLL